MNKLRKPPSGFTMVPNALIRSATLSLKAKGLYCLLFAKPDNWTYVEEALIKESADGREAYRSGITELVEAGWLTKVQVRDDKGVFSHIDWCLSVDGKPVNGLPVAGEPAAGKSPTNNTDENNTDKNKTVSPISPKPTKASSRANSAIRLIQFLENTGGHPPCEWGDYPRREHGWDATRLNTVWRAFSRYWNSPDCRKPLKRDWYGTWQNWCDREAQNSGGGRAAGGGAGGNLAAAVNGFVARRKGVPGQDGNGDVSGGGGAGEDAGNGGMYLPNGEIAF